MPKSREKKNQCQSMENSSFSIFLKKRSCLKEMGLVFNLNEIEIKDNLVLAKPVGAG